MTILTWGRGLAVMMAAGCGGTISRGDGGPGVDLGAAAMDLRMPIDLASTDLGPACAMVTSSTLAGNGTAGFVDGTGGSMGTTEFNAPYGLAVDSAGTVYVADSLNFRVRKVAPSGATTTLAGNGTRGSVDGTGGAAGTAQFVDPHGIAVDTAGNVYVAEQQDNRIRKVAPDGTTTTLAGTGAAGFVDGTGGRNGTAQFTSPLGLAVDGAGNVYVADTGNERIRKLAPNGSTTTLTGDGTPGFVDGTGGATGTTRFNSPRGVALDGAGNLYVADFFNARIRKVAPSGATTTLAGNGTVGFKDGTGGAAGTTQFRDPSRVAVDGVGNVYVSDTTNQRIRRVAPDGTTETVVGDGTAGTMDGVGCVARVSQPFGIAVLGNVLFVSEVGANRVRKIQLP